MTPHEVRMTRRHQLRVSLGAATLLLTLAAIWLPWHWQLAATTALSFVVLGLVQD
jgi:hypothetical protein